MKGTPPPPTAADEALNREIFTILGKESDRGCILVANAYLEVCLERLLRARFAAEPGSRKAVAVDALLRTRGPLGTMWARTQFALIEGLVHEWQFDDLEVIRGLRNRCAHNLKETTFDIVEVQEEIKKLKTPEHLKTPDDQEYLANLQKKWPRKFYRHTFEATVAHTAGFIQGRADAERVLAGTRAKP